MVRGDKVAIQRSCGFNPYEGALLRVVSVQESGFVHLYDDDLQQNVMYDLSGEVRGYSVEVIHRFDESPKPAPLTRLKGPRKRRTELRLGVAGYIQIDRQDAVYCAPSDTKFVVGDRVLIREMGECKIRLTKDGISEVWFGKPRKKRKAKK